MPFSEIDPSLAIGFLCSSAAEVAELELFWKTECAGMPFALTVLETCDFVDFPPADQDEPSDDREERNKSPRGVGGGGEAAPPTTTTTSPNEKPNFFQRLRLSNNTNNKTVIIRPGNNESSEESHDEASVKTAKPKSNDDDWQLL